MSPTLAALEPLAVRVCPWLVAGPEPASPEEPDDVPVRAMTLVLHLERDAPPRTAVLEAAADAALALCLDPRAAPGGPWFDAVATWAGAGRIRKLARRARTSHWRAVQELDGVTVLAGPDVTEEPEVAEVAEVAEESEVTQAAPDGTNGYLVASRRANSPLAAEVRALVPGPVDEVAHEVRRLQITGTDLPPDEPGPPPSGRAVIWLNPRVEQSTGKAAAQVGHASMILATVLGAAGEDPGAARHAAVRVAATERWDGWVAALERDPTGREAWERDGVTPVRDAGFTEVAPGTVTCLAQRA